MIVRMRRPSRTVSRPGQPPSKRPISKPHGEDARRPAAQAAHRQRQLLGAAASPAGGVADEAAAAPSR